MKEIACRDMGADCDFKATAETIEELVPQVMAHAQSAHPQKWEEMKDMPAAEIEKLVSGIAKDI